MRRTMGIAVAILLGGPWPAAAQNGPSKSIDAFNGFPWGTSESAIVEQLGPPLQADTLEQGILVLVYQDELAGIATVAMYAVFPDEGLVKGQHTVAFDDVNDCESTFRTLRTHVLLSYPMIVPVDQSRNDSMETFCEAVRAGLAEWISTWEDAETGARAMVVIESGRPRLSVIVESSTFIRWAENRETGNS